jgi:hypothetical protein
MIYSVKRYLDVLERYKITPHQFLLPFLISLNDGEKNLTKGQVRASVLLGDSGSSIAAIYRYTHLITGGTGPAWVKEDLDSLVSGGALKKIVGDGYISPENLIPTRDFIETVFTNTGDFEEFYFESGYPVSIPRDDGMGAFPAKTANKDEIEKIYREKIVTKDQHMMLVQATSWAAKRKLIRVGIEKYLLAEQYRDFHRMMIDQIPDEAGHIHSGNESENVDF